MRILIVEDEALIAQRIERLIKEILGQQLRQLNIKSTLESARHHIHHHPIDLLILDLNLNGKNGFKLLEETVAGAFQTMILSAYIDQAILAYEYGVLDFIPKPFNKKRLQTAFERYTNHTYRAEYPTKFLAVRKKQKLQLISVDDIIYIKGAGNHSEISLNNGQNSLHDKSLNHLTKLLSSDFERIHKSFIVNLKMVASISNKYEINLKNGETIPISRAKYKAMKDQLS